MPRLPDFVIIGAMKCATSTLHDQLAMQQGIFMSTPKEPYFFSNDEVWCKGLAWYEQLFAQARDGDLCGESSTHYTKLPTYPQTVERMRSLIPNAKLVYVIRHPIDRLISHYIHDWSENKIKVSIDNAVHSYPDLIEYSRYAMQIEPFLNTYGPNNVLLVLFERFTKSPQLEIERIARFIGYKKSISYKNDHATNVSEKRMRKNAFRDAVVRNPVITLIRKRLVPKSLRESIKAKWQMKERPRISSANEQLLEKIFDEDLKSLSNRMNFQLSCANFKEMSKINIPDWK